MTVETNPKNELNHYFNFSNPDSNPLAPQQIQDIGKAIESASEIANAFYNNSDVFKANAENLLAACIWHLQNYNPQDCNLRNVFSMITGNSIEDLLEILQSDEECLKLTKSLYEGIKQGSTVQIKLLIQPLKTHINEL